MGVLLCKLPISLTQKKKKILWISSSFQTFQKQCIFPFYQTLSQKMPLGASVEVFNGRRKNEMSMKFPLPEGKERQGKHINEEDYRTHRLTGVQVSMTFSNWKHHVLKPVTFSIHFVASTCIAFSVHTSCAELLLRFLLKLPNIFFAIRILTAAGSEALPDWCIHSIHQQKQHPGQAIQFQIPK